MGKIKGGYVLQPRAINSSDVMKMPPVTRELWFYLCRNVQWKEFKQLKRGQGYFNLKSIQEHLSWMVGYRKMTYSKPQLTKSLRRMREGFMIETMRATHGLVITVCNYNHYQDSGNYESNGEGAREGNAKETEGFQYKQEGKKKAKKEEKESKDSMKRFDEWWDLYSKKTGRKKSKAKFLSLSEAEQLACIKSAPSYVVSTPVSQYRKHPLTYLNGAHWEDKPDVTPEQEEEMRKEEEEIKSQETTWRVSHGFDFMIDGSHEPIWEKESEKLGITLQQYAKWRGEQGPYSEDRPLPEREYGVEQPSEDLF